MAIETMLATAVVGGGIVNALGSVQEGKATSAAANYNAQLAYENAGIARAQARVDADDKRREADKYLASLRAAFGANGVAFEGSALDVFEDNAAEGELAARRIEYGGELKARGYMHEVVMQRAKAKNATTAGYMGALSSIFGAGTSLYKLRQPGGASA